MAYRPLDPDNGDDTGGGTDHESVTSTPRWVKISGIVAAAVILLVVILLIIGGGHGPSRHTPSGGLGRTSASSVSGVGL
jgi:hypothetical protein